ncbi:MAG: hypothetical protein LBK03_01220 [Bacteroidales bacterium]|jgi:hypothetical protein|nr:hypothetical protein [Bacteroidales bacterium]
MSETVCTALLASWNTAFKMPFSGVLSFAVAQSQSFWHLPPPLDLSENQQLTEISKNLFCRNFAGTQVNFHPDGNKFLPKWKFTRTPVAFCKQTKIIHNLKNKNTYEKVFKNHNLFPDCDGIGIHSNVL